MHLAVAGERTYSFHVPSSLPRSLRRLHDLPIPITRSSSKRIRPLGAEELLLIRCFWYTMRQGELQALCDKLLEIWSFDLFEP